jgi:hypothetical protein
MPQRNVMGIVLAVIVLIMAGLTLWGVVTPPYGLASATRCALAIVGIVGAMLFFKRNPHWFVLLCIWSVAQLHVIIVDPSGPLTNQAFHLGVIFSQSNSVNGQVSSTSGYGVNLVGVIFLVLAIFARRGERASPPPPSQP